MYLWSAHDLLFLQSHHHHLRTYRPCPPQWVVYHHQAAHRQVGTCTVDCDNAIKRSVSFLVTITIIASSVAGVLVLIVVLSLILFGALIYCKLKQNKGEATINNTKGMCGDETLYT